MIKSILGGKSKNLFDISKADVMINANIFNPTPAKWECFYKIPVTSGQTYTVSCDTTANAGAGTQLQLSAQTGDKWNEGTQLFIFLTSQEMIKDWVHIKATFTIPDNVTQITFSALDNKFFRNFQLELGSTATEYVPHELTSYKSIMKVSDVCQLVDPKYIHTIVDRGVTFTSNGDGSITVNGTPIGEYYSLETIALNIKSIKPNHKYLVYDVNKDPIISELIIANYQGGYIFKGIGNIFTFPEHDYTRFVFEIRVNLNQTANNIVVRPQLFDLTEMFGAGNEPKTVAEFKAKFPNDYYPYSPSCFVTSFDKRMPCKTKNLFNYKNSDSTAKTITSNGVTLSLKNDYFELYGTQQEDKYFECSLTQFNIPFTAGKTYTLSLDNAIPQLAVVYFNGFYNDDTTKQLNLLRVQGTNNNPLKTFTPTKDGYFSQIVVYSPKSHRFSGNYNMRVQIEENSHKSEYVPHNYV